MSEFGEVLHALIDVVSGRKAQLSHEEAAVLHEVVDGASAPDAPAAEAAPVADVGPPEPGPDDTAPDPVA